MSDIPKNNQIQRICRLSYQLKSNLVSVGNDPDAFHQEVIFKSGINWLDIYFTPNKIEYNEPPVQDANGLYYDIKLKLSFPNEADSNLNLFQALENSALILRLEYSNGNSKLFGDMNYPVHCLIHYATAIDSGFEIEFYSKSPKRSVWLSKTTNAL